ncbi:MAG: 6-carboxytetrahydropterin synthase QueD [Deltaproteobacteria bacterium]|nr:6-carboxytetrahydropterin synthase QueD [Deltaproteobacteria bacterium]
MYELTVETSFSSAHNLRGYEGACENLHGHNWKVEAHLTASRLNDIGMVVDFKLIKNELKKIIEKLDHKYLNEVPPFDKDNTTAENIARFIFRELSSAFEDGNVRLSKVRVWESENSAAAYSE